MAKKITIPMLRDHHNHISFYGVLHHCINLQEIPDKKKALDLMQHLDRNTVTPVLGWNTGFYRFTHEELKDLPPVIIVNISLHSFLMNPAAEDMLKDQYPDIIANYMDPAWYEDHMPRMLIFLANRVEPTIERIKTFFDYLYQKGVYYAEDMLLTGDKFYSAIRSTPYAERTAFWADMETFKSLSPETQKGVTGIKLFTDGAVGARTAALSEPFKSGEKGYLLFPDEEMYRLMREVSVLGKAVSVHAIGDLAVSQAVRAARRLYREGLWFPRFRLEHCQFIPESAAREARDMGIVISMQPNFSGDSVNYIDRLSPRYLQWNNPFRMLIDSVGFVPGEDLILGSDGMPQGVEGALSSALFPPFPHQRLTLEEFTAAYCMPDRRYGEIQVEIDETAVLAVNPPADPMRGNPIKGLR